MRYLLHAMIVAALCLTLQAETLVFGVVPQQSPLKLLKVWQPFAAYLEQQTGIQVVLKTEHSIPAFEEVLYAGGYDVAYMNPYHYVVANAKQGYRAAARADKNIVGILVGHVGVPVEDFSSLRGKTFLFPAPYAFAATLLTKYELLKFFGLNVDEACTVRYVNSHDSVYKGIARGVGDIGGGIERTYNNLSDLRSKAQLTVLYRTRAYPSHPFALKPTLSDKTRRKIVDAILSMPVEILAAMSMKRIIPVDDAAYDTVRDIADELSLPK